MDIKKINKKSLKIPYKYQEKNKDFMEDEKEKLKLDIDIMKYKINELEKELIKKTRENQNLYNKIKLYEAQLSKKSEEIERIKKKKNKLFIAHQNHFLLNENN